MAYSEDHIALAAEYALGTLDADERALVETMMIVDPGFKDLVDAWDRKLAPLHQMVEAVEPPADLWDRIKVAAGVGVSHSPAASAVITPESETTGSIATASATTDSDAGLPAASGASEAAPVAPDVMAEDREAIAAAPSNVVPLPTPKRIGFYGPVMTAVAASLAAVLALQAYRPELLPEALRIKPQVKVVEVKAPATAVPAQFVAVLQQGSAQPAFILTVDTTTRQFTVRRVGATPEPSKSYELWLVSDKLPQPRSLGVIGEGEFTARSALQAYDPDVVSNATYAVTIEPKGGSPTGVATGPIVYTGKLVESVPAR